MTRLLSNRFLQPALVLFIFVVDRWTKVWAEGPLASVRSIRVLPFFHLTYVQNTGAAWGMMQGRNAFLIGFSFVLLGALLFVRRRWPRTNYWAHYGLVLVAGGALGNLYDRVVFGYVIDFLDFLVWPVFNVADSCITVGACCLAWGLHREEKVEARLEG